MSAEHRIRWFVRIGDDEWVPRQASMRGLWFYDARCSCGWKSRTGGGTRASVAEKVADHKHEAAWAAAHPEVAR
jgi:hypothetical protein